MLTMDEVKKTRILIQDFEEFQKKFKFSPNKSNQAEEENQKEENSTDSQLSIPEKTIEPIKIFAFPVKDINPEDDLAFRKEVVAFIMYHYDVHKELPKRHHFEERFPINRLPKTLEDWKIFLYSLEAPLNAQGITPYETPSDYLEPNFLLAVSLLVTVVDKRSFAAKLKEAGLTTRQWKNFLNIPKYHDYYRSRVNKIFSEELAEDAKVQLAQAIHRGDLQAIKYYHEFQNIYRPQGQDVNKLLLSLLHNLMEILARHVQPDTLNKIASEISEAKIIDTSSLELKAG